MKRPLAVVVQLAAVAAAALVLALVLAQSGFYGSVRDFPDPVPGVEWKDVVAFAVPFLALAWVFVVRRGATASLVGLLTAVVLFAGHPWSSLDWTLFLWRGIGLAHGRPPSPAIVVAFLAVFAGAALYQLLRRRRALGRAYAAKNAEPEDQEAAWTASRAGALGTFGWALAASAVALAGVLALSRLRPGLGASTALALGLLAVAVVGAGLAIAPTVWERVAYRVGK